MPVKHMDKQRRLYRNGHLNRTEFRIELSSPVEAGVLPLPSLGWCFWQQTRRNICARIKSCSMRSKNELMISYQLKQCLGTLVERKISSITEILHNQCHQQPWCSWLSHALHTGEVPGSIPGGCIFLTGSFLLGFFWALHLVCSSFFLIYKRGFIVLSDLAK